MTDDMRAKTVDPFGVADTFVSGLAEVEDIGGGCLRFLFYSKQHIGDGEEWVVVAKLVAPVEAVPPAVLMASRAVGFTCARAAFCRGRGAAVH